MATLDSKTQEVKNRFEIVGSAPGLIRALEVAIKIAPTDISALILGESGVGKENFSKIIHHLSKRKHNGFIAINCGAIPEGTIDSELFGHEKGSFTSAIDHRKGYFETVDKGTIFLDEIGELPMETQSRLLRVLESGEFIKVGSSKVQKSDVRVVAATNKDLFQLAQQGKFREDLYYRLSTVSIHIPPLRDRPEDIPYLFYKFANDMADKYNSPPVELDDSAIATLKQFPWPGNIRQLKNFVEQLSILESERHLTDQIIQPYLATIQHSKASALPPPVHLASQEPQGINERELLYKFLVEIKRDVSDIKSFLGNSIVPNYTAAPVATPAVAPNRLLAAPASPEYQRRDASAIADPQEDFDHHEELLEAKETLSIHDKEMELIRKALVRHGGKRKQAATELGISERTLYRKIKEFGLED